MYFWYNCKRVIFYEWRHMGSKIRLAESFLAIYWLALNYLGHFELAIIHKLKAIYYGLNKKFQYEETLWSNVTIILNVHFQGTPPVVTS